MKRALQILSFLPFFVFSQHEKVNYTDDQPMCEAPLKPKHKVDSTKQIKSLIDFFTHGEISGHVRNYFMATFNEGSLKDYYTNALGGAIHYETAKIWGFSFGVKGIFTYNIFGNNLNEKDPAVGKSAKWEKELYDVLNPHDKVHMDRLEELYIDYAFRKSFIRLGKQDIGRTPLLSRRDGRMKPFVFEGLYFDINEVKNLNIKGGFFYKVSPRSMTEWFHFNEAMGLNNNGFQPNGEKAHYHEHTNSVGVGMLGLTYTIKEKYKVQVWNYYFDKMVNTTWLQFDFNHKGLIGGLQYVLSVPMPYLNKLDYVNRYMQPDEVGNVMAFRIGYKDKQFLATANYAKGFGTGRFLFPRELGREALYTSLPRSWMDGFGKADVLTIVFKYQGKRKKTKGIIAEYGFTSVWTGGIDDLRYNKYAVQSYIQNNVYIAYKFQNVLKGLEIGLLYINRYNHIGADNRPELIFNKSQYNQINIIANIKF